jgi:site-specific DNA-methyltransferase (adenine-specific)
MGQRLEEAGFRVDFSFIGWAQAQGFPKSQNMSKAIDRRFGAEREVIGTKHYADGKTRPNILSTDGCNDGWKRPAHLNYSGDRVETAPSTPEAQQFEGSFAGLQLKPCLEVIICVMKSLDKSCKTYVDQALQNGHGVTWLGDLKIPYISDYDKKEATHHGPVIRNNFAPGQGKKGVETERPPCDGRFPANLLCSDDVLDDGKNHKSGTMNKVLAKHDHDNWVCYGTYGPSEYNVNKSEGSFSRYFSLDAWFDKKLQELPEHIQKTFPFLIVPKPSKSEKNKYIENKHPTVKPLKLMSYLITMGSREGDVILDPFAGSGTTLEACRLLNRSFIGIDKDPENEKYMVARGQLNVKKEVTLSDFPEVSL